MPLGIDPSKIRAVLFDVDGTLVDTLDGVVRGLGDASVQFFGYRPSDHLIRGLVGRPIRVQLQTFAGKEIDPAALDAMADYTIDRFEHYKNLERLFEPAVEALLLCHRCGLKVGLVTSKSARELELFLPRFSGTEAVEAAVCSSDVRSPKPAPDCALLACERLGVPPSQAVFIADSIYDVRCAHDAGMPAVAVAYGSAPLDDLRAESPEVLLETPEALLEWVQASLAPLPCPERS
ncbi:MAG TPA: HAD family hydrolase [Fimbriimonas sp.]